MLWVNSWLLGEGFDLFLDAVEDLILKRMFQEHGGRERGETEKNRSNKWCLIRSRNVSLIFVEIFFEIIVCDNCLHTSTHTHTDNNDYDNGLFM